MIKTTRMITIGLLLLANLVVAACGTTTKLMYVQPKPFQFQQTVEPKLRTVRVHKDDQPLYEAYIDKFREQILFHNKQIDDYLNTFRSDK